MTEKPTSYVPRSMGAEYGHHLEGPATADRLRDDIATALFYEHDGKQVFRWADARVEMGQDFYISDVIDAVYAAVRPHIDKLTQSHTPDLVDWQLRITRALCRDCDSRGFRLNDGLHGGGLCDHGRWWTEAGRILDGIRPELARLTAAIDALRARAEQAEDRLDGQAWEDLTAEWDALRGQLADSEDALERAKTEARIAIAQRDRWRDAAREADQHIQAARELCDEAVAERGEYERLVPGESPQPALVKAADIHRALVQPERADEPAAPVDLSKPPPGPPQPPWPPEWRPNA
jgi:hypothetical protein